MNVKIQSTDSKVILYVCHNCFPQGKKLPRQWNHDGIHVQVKEVPCSGKIDIQYLFHAIEGGAQGVCVITCPQGECTLAQGNYRAQVRIQTVRNLLAEIGLEAERASLVHFSPKDSFDCLKKLVDNEVKKFSELEPNPITALC